MLARSRLRPSLDYAQIPSGEDQHKVMIAMLDRFEGRLQQVANGTKNFVLVPTHRTFLTGNEWGNKLYPKDPGFFALARKFQTVLQQHLDAYF
jgi:hypothetical protein